MKLVPVILYQMMNGPLAVQLFTSVPHLALLLQLASKLTWYYLTYECPTLTYMYVGTRLIDKHDTCMVVLCFSWYTHSTLLRLISC